MVATAPRKPARRVSDAPRLYYTQGDIAQMLNLSVSKISEMSLTGVLPGRIEFGRSVRHERGAIERWLEEQAQGPRDAA